MGIDVRSIPTERLREEEIKIFFTPSKKSESVTEQDTVYIMGPRGSGKSMILQYLSTRIQIERFKSDSLIDYDKNNLGIYIRGTEHYFGTVKETLDKNGNPEELWQKKFTHLFNLTACELVLRDLERMKHYPLIVIDPFEEQTVCKEICSILEIENKNKFLEVKDMVREEIRNHSKNINEDFNSILTISSFLSELQEVLTESIADFKNKWIVILLDEYQELSFFQKQVISEIVSVRKPIFKVATLPPELNTQREEFGKSINLLSDFITINIGTHNLTPNSTEFNDVRDFFKIIANKRLKTFGYDVDKFLVYNPSEPPTSQENNYSGLDNLVLLSSGNVRIFLKMLHAVFKEWNGRGVISMDTQNIAIKKFASQLMDGIEFIPRISPYVFRSIILKIGLLFKNYLKETQRNYLQIGIKDPENLSDESLKFIFLAMKKNYLMAPAVERYSRGGFKLLSITLSNALLPYFDLPLQTHQVCELSYTDIDKLFDRRSVISGIKIMLEGEIQPTKLLETLDPYLSVVQEIVDHAKNNDLGIFVGSGLSTELGYPTGTVLAQKIANHFNIEYVGDDLPTISERVLVQRERGDLIKYIRNVLEKSKTRESKSYKKLTDFNLDEIYTTNWDSSIEDEFKKKFVSTEKIVRDDHITLAGNRKPLIYKMHGDFDHPDMFVITNDDSISLEKTRPLLVNSLKNSLARKHFLFLGYSMEDLDFKTIFHLIKDIQGDLPLTSYAATIIDSEDKLGVLKAKGIIPLSIKGETLIDAIHMGVMEK